jgi:hypothetical protein
MEREAIAAIIAKAASKEEPKWTTVMAKKVRQVETLADAHKQEERKLNLRIMGFEAKEGEIKELVKRLNTELLQSQMRLHTRIIAATQQRPLIVWASTQVIGARCGVVLLKFITS